MRRNTLLTGVAAAAALLALAVPLACSEAKAEPLEVTYYYLPG